MESTVNEDAKTGENKDQHGRFFTLFVDDREFHVEQAVISGAQIMNLAGIPRDVGVVLLLEDGTQRTFGADETIELEPGRRFKKAPRFKRG